MAEIRTMVLAVCAAVMLAGCGAGTEPVSQPPPATLVPAGTLTATATIGPPPTAVPEKLNFTGKTVDGAEFSGASLAGKPAVLWFWAPWCSKCRSEAAGVASAAKATAGSVSFVGVAARDEVPAMQDFVRRYDLSSFPHVADADAAVWKRFGVVEQPAYAFVKPDGTVEVVTSRVSAEDLMARAKALAG
jgi:thiol-disulfide isomerase/thioredoxin